MHVPCHPDPAEQRRDHGRAGHDHQRAEQDRDAPVPADKGVHGERPADRRHQRPHRDEPADRRGLAPDPAQVQVQTALEQDHGHGEADQRLQAVAQRVRPHHVQQVRAEQHAREEQQHDARNAQMSRDGLRDHPRCERDRECERRVRGGHRLLPDRYDVEWAHGPAARSVRGAATGTRPIRLPLRRTLVRPPKVRRPDGRLRPLRDLDRAHGPRPTSSPRLYPPALTIHAIPKRSTTMPNRSAQNVFSCGPHPSRLARPRSTSATNERPGVRRRRDQPSSSPWSNRTPTPRVSPAGAGGP